MKIVPLNADHDRSSFDCGSAELNSFLRKMARQASSRNISRTFVLTDEAAPEKILGFFSLTSCEVNIADVPLAYQKKYPPQHGLPAVRLARLAVAQKEQGKGYGEYLLTEAMVRTAVVAESVGIMGLYVDAKDENARRFYERYGFVVINPVKPMQLFLPIGTLQKLIGESFE
ncbi:GNAT family N-acetyltransferase [Geomonas anaerohicana]|nr:GNAT family N-acetyltransferase [Geomonas anaerohicana]